MYISLIYLHTKTGALQDLSLIQITLRTTVVTDKLSIWDTCSDACQRKEIPLQKPSRVVR